jgi:hypothetical protein
MKMVELPVSPKVSRRAPRRFMLWKHRLEAFWIRLIALKTKLKAWRESMIGASLRVRHNLLPLLLFLMKLGYTGNRFIQRLMRCQQTSLRTYQNILIFLLKTFLAIPMP